MIKTECIVFFFVVLIINTFSLKSQTYIAKAEKAGIRKSGYINIQGEFVIPPKFTYCYDFHECGLAAVYDNIKDELFYINVKGDTVVRKTEHYDLLKPIGPGLSVPVIDEGLIAIKSNGLMGYIDIENNPIIPAVYDSISTFENGLAIAVQDERYYVLSRSRKRRLIKDFNCKRFSSFHHGFARFTDQNDNIGFVNTFGKTVIEPQYKAAGNFVNGLCYALGSRGKFGFIDTLGNWRIKPRFSTARDFSESDNMALVTSWAEAIEGYAMPNGNCLYPSQIVGLDHFQEGVAKARPFDRLKYGFIDVYGEQFIPADFKYARGFKNGYAIAATDRLLGVIDKTGLWVIYPKFVYIGDFTLIN